MDNGLRILERKKSADLYSNICEYPHCSNPSFKNCFHSRRSFCNKHHHDDQIVLKHQLDCSISKAKLHVQCIKQDILKVKQFKNNLVPSYEAMENNLKDMIVTIQKRREELVKLKTESLDTMNEQLDAMEQHVDVVDTAVSELEQSYNIDSYTTILENCEHLMELVHQVKNGLPEQINAIEIRAPWHKILSNLNMSFQSITLDTKRVMTSSALLSNLSLSTEHYLKPKEINIMKDEKIPYIWCVDKVSELRKKSCPIYSPEFDTHVGGYKAQMVIYFNGFGTGKDTHTSLCLRLCRNNSDKENSWPFPWSFVFGIVDQECLSASQYSSSFAFALQGSQFREYFQQSLQSGDSKGLSKLLGFFQKQKSVVNRFLGKTQLMDIKTLNASDKYIKDDKLFVAVVLLK